jgi:hypothetical protein
MGTELPGAGPAGQLHVGDIPVAHTPPGGYGKVFPKPVLSGCKGPLVHGAPDLRGMWQVTAGEVKGKPAPATHSAYRHFERIEQCGDRICITGGGVIHDMRCDGTVEHGVDDVMARDFKTRIKVPAAYENGVHVLRPIVGFPLRLIASLRGYKLEVTRRLDGEDMVWQYSTFKARLKRTGGPESLPPAIR